MLTDKLQLYLITNRNKEISEKRFLDIIKQAIIGGDTVKSSFFISITIIGEAQTMK